MNGVLSPNDQVPNKEEPLKDS